MDQNIIVFICVGFVAQVIDGALGMAYGVSATTFLLTLGVPPAAASASVHAAEVFTTGVSGLSHIGFGNVDKYLLKKLLVPGVIGAVLGAYILTVVPGDAIKPLVAVYMIVMGLLILRKALKRDIVERRVTTKIIRLGFIGGLLDAMGGGGWGPIVSSTLIARGNNPRFTIGSVNMAEFFVAVAASATFLLSIGLGHWKMILGLIIGGVFAAPFAAYICKKLPSRVLLMLVGGLITLLAIRIVYQTLF
ncbi:MAG: sulfite exporter TauE/SafE family protein [Abditibacteriales bacterium]|nr:sulfite exporter TauE/SafE family protein [Abditibacteriales bacterium]MDW8366430.1 sulfite exporter TauE/SafE family protein [Abditibacteriales bacterium]